MTPPVFAHGNLRLYLLALLEEQPRHGYELIQALSDRFGGTYSPSAGTIYPRLAKLEEEGLVTKRTDGRKSVYEITDAGRAELESRRHELDAIEDVPDVFEDPPISRSASRGRDCCSEGAVRLNRTLTGIVVRETRTRDGFWIAACGRLEGHGRTILKPRRVRRIARVIPESASVRRNHASQ
jgi:DNA-binding PadR family transcriptional regulator